MFGIALKNFCAANPVKQLVQRESLLHHLYMRMLSDPNLLCFRSRLDEFELGWRF